MAGANRASCRREPEAPRGRVAASLALVLLATLAVLLVGLGSYDAMQSMERLTVVVAQETWLRVHQEDASPLMTWNDSVPRARKPPLVTWTSFVAWAGLDPDTAQPSTLVYRARLAALVMALVVVASTFWIGVTMGGLRLGTIAGLVAGSIVLFQREARTASYDIHLTAWVTLAVACALWAMRPRDTGGWRTVLGWAGCALAMTAGVMAKNPVAMLLVALPVGAAIALRRERRGALAGFGGALLLTTLLAGAWYLHVFVAYEGIFSELRAEVAEVRDTRQKPYYYVILLLLVAPWSIWLVAGLIHPFTAENAPRRRRLLVAWSWFVLLFLMFSLAGAKHQRYILPIIPAVALMVGAVWSDHDERARRGDPLRAERWIFWLHGGSLVVASMLVPPLFLVWGQAEAPSGPALGPTPVVFVLAVTLVLLVIAVVSLRSHLRGFPARAAILTATWTLVLLSAFWFGASRSSGNVHRVRAVAESVRDRTGDLPVRRLALPDRPTCNEGFRIYYGRLLPRVVPDELPAFLTNAPAGVFVMAEDTPEAKALLGEAGMEDEGPVEIKPHEPFRLWSYAVRGVPSAP